MSTYTAKALKEELGQVVKNIQANAQKPGIEQRAMSEDEQLTHDKLWAQKLEIESKIESQIRVEQAASIVETREEKRDYENYQTRINPNFITNEERELGMRGWAIRHMNGQPRKEIETAMEKLGTRNSFSQDITLQLPRKSKAIWERRGSGQSEGTWPQNSTSGSAGGFLVQQSEILHEVDVALKYYGGIRQACRAVRTPKGMELWAPTVNDVSNVASIHSENATPDETDFAFSHQAIPVFTYDTASYPISIELMQDTAVPLMEIMSELVGVRIGRKFNTDATTGNGSGAPEGLKTDVVANGTTYTTATASTGVVLYSDINNFIFTLDKAYRDLPSACIMASDSWMKTVYSLVDSNNRPLVEFSMDDINNKRESVVGWRVVTNNDLDAVAAGNTCAAVFGPFEKCIVRDALDLQIRIIQDYFLATALGYGLIAWMRSGFKTINPSAFVAFKIHS